MATDRSVDCYAFSVEAVVRAIRSLSNTRSHEHFPGYLALLRERTSPDPLRSTDIVEFYDARLRIEDAPEQAPYLRPFRSRGVGKPLTLYQRNVAGSYAPSSIREGRALSRVIRVEEASSGQVEYSLPSEHWSIVLSEMLSGHRQPLLATAAFLLRDCAFPLEDGPSLDGAIEVFRRELNIRPSDPDGDVVFETLFEDDRDTFSNDDLEGTGEQRQVGSPSFQVSIPEAWRP